MTKDEFRDIVLALDPDATHYFSESKAPAYTTWHEYQRHPLYGDNAPAEDAWRFQLDYFTKVEDDPQAETIYQTLARDDRITVTYLPRYEKETGYIHHIYQCAAV